MASGFALGGFAEGLSSGLTSSTDILAKRRQLGQKDRALGLQEQEFEQEKQQAEQKLERETQQAGLDQAVGALDSFENVISETAKNVGPGPALKAIDSPSLQKQVFEAERAAMRAEEALGITRGGNLEARVEARLDSFRRIAQSQPTAAQAGDADANRRLAEAESLREATGVPLNQALGFTPETALKVQRIVEAIQAAEPGSLEHTSLLQALKKEVAVFAGQSITISPDGTVTIGSGQAGSEALKASNVRDRDRNLTTQGELKNGLEIIDFLSKQVEQNPGIFGLPGSIRRKLETGGSIADDLINNIPGLGPQMTAAIKASGGAVKGLLELFEKEGAEELAPATTGDLAILQSILRFRFARMIQPGDKLLASTLSEAKNAVNLTGLTGSRQVSEALAALAPQFESALARLEQRLQLGVQGETDVESVSSLRAPANASPTIPIPALEALSDEELLRLHREAQGAN